MKIMLDPGHGWTRIQGGDTGATYQKTDEDDLNLAIGLFCRDRLKIMVPDWEVVMTRDKDCPMSISDRISLEHREKPDVFVSIHCNAIAGNPRIQGIEIWTWKGSFQGLALAHSLENQLKTIGAIDRGILLSDNDPNTWQRNLAVLSKTICPASLVECGYMTNPAELQRLSDPAHQRSLADCIAKGIVDYLKTKEAPNEMG